MSTETYTPAVGDRVIIDPAVASARFLGKVYARVRLLLDQLRSRCRHRRHAADLRVVT